jgi:hypothetical protein
MAAVAVQVPDDVFAMPVLPPPDLSTWNGEGVPAAVVLHWVDNAPMQAWSVAMLAEVDPAELSPRDLPAYVRLCDRAEAFMAARKSAGISALAGPKDQLRHFGTIESPANEVCVALHIPLGAAQTEIHRARRLASHLPRTRRLFRDGLITARHVAKIVAGTSGLDTCQCAQVEAMVLDEAEHISVHEFARRVRRAVAKVDPKDFKERHRKAAKQSDVTCDPDEDAMAWLTARMPLPDALIVKKAVDHHALAAKKAGDTRPIGVLRAEALRTFAEAYLNGTLTSTVPTHHGRPVEVGIVATPEALLGLTDTPGEIPGVGPVPIELVRAMAADARLRWLTIRGGDGALLQRGPTSWRIPAKVHAHADATYVMSVGPHSTVPAERCDGEHLVPHPHGPTDNTNIAPMDRPWHIGKTFGGCSIRRLPDGILEWHTPLGQRVRVRPFDYRLGP